jgi:CheY-like chemotaxis protein
MFILGQPATLISLHHMPDKTVLIVEDNPVERERLAVVLEREGYGVLATANGKEAIERLRGKITPDVMLLDMMTSDLDGWGVLALFRRCPVKFPIIIVTGLDIASDEWARSLGASGLVHKPVDVPYLRQQLRDALGE